MQNGGIFKILGGGGVWNMKTLLVAHTSIFVPLNPFTVMKDKFLLLMIL